MVCSSVPSMVTGSSDADTGRPSALYLSIHLRTRFALIPCARATPATDARALVREGIDPLAIAAQPFIANPQT